ncbi:MAG: hypothetical protein ABID71_09095 [Chloroflexota bacterium]
MVGNITLASRASLCADIFRKLDAERLNELNVILKDLRKNLFTLMNELGRWLCYRVLWLKDRGMRHSKESAMVKWWCPRID